MGRLEGKSVIITGAGSGIGRAASVLFSREGAKLIIVDKTDGVELPPVNAPISQPPPMPTMSAMITITAVRRIPLRGAWNSVMGQRVRSY